MKKLLVVLVAAMMVVSMAAVAMAAVTVKGDFRYEVISDSSLTGDAKVYDNPDFRLIFDGPVSDTFNVHMQTRAQGIVKQQNDKGGSWYCDEYWFQFKQSWGTIQVGSWDYKDTPSRVLVKSNGNNIIPRNEVQLAVDVPFESGLFVGFLYDLDQSSDLKVGDGAYAVKVGYKNDLFGVQVMTEDYGLDSGSDAGYSVLAYDLFYNINDDMKVYLYARDPKKDASDLPDAENIIGFLYKNIAGSKVQASLEYGIDEQEQDKNSDGKSLKWNQLGLQVIVPFNNGLSLEIEHTNFATSIDTEETKDVFRFRAKF